MYLIVGLGNPGIQYNFTRHNAGFRVIDSLCRTLNISLEKNKNSANYHILQQDEVIIAKPTVYMNLSGQPVSALARFYKIPINQIILIHDDLDITLGIYKYKEGGSSGGHNGIKDIQNKLQSEAMKRIKVGIGKPALERISTRDWVLMPFLPDELSSIGLCTSILVRKLIHFIKSADKKTDVLSASYLLQ